MPITLIVDENGDVFRRSTSDVLITLNLQQHLERALYKNLNFMTPNILLGPSEWVSHVHVFFQRSGTATLMLRLNALNFNTTWVSTLYQEQQVLRPTFGYSEQTLNPANSTEELKKLIYRIPSELFLFLLVDAKLPCFTINPAMASLLGWIATPKEIDPDNAGKFKLVTLPLPNVFPDGTLCMGEQSYSTPHDALHASLELADVWMNSPWNSDLMNDAKERSNRHLFRWTEEGSQIILDSRDFFSQLSLVSPGNKHPASLPAMNTWMEHHLALTLEKGNE